MRRASVVVGRKGTDEEGRRYKSNRRKIYSFAFGSVSNEECFDGKIDLRFEGHF